MIMENKKIEIKEGREIPFDQLISLYDSVGWAAYTNEERRSDLKKAVRNSSCVITAWCEGTLIALARGLSDDVSIFYLQDILVSPEFQRRGIGKQLLTRCLERYQHVRSRVLLTDDEEKQMQFYESMGFINTKNLKQFKINAFVLTDGVT